MQEKTNIQTSTLRVPKNILEEIKIYCRKAGKPVGEWVETAWKFIEKTTSTSMTRKQHHFFL